MGGSVGGGVGRLAYARAGWGGVRFVDVESYVAEREPSSFTGLTDRQISTAPFAIHC